MSYIGQAYVFEVEGPLYDAPIFIFSCILQRTVLPFFLHVSQLPKIFKLHIMNKAIDHYETVVHTGCCVYGYLFVLLWFYIRRTFNTGGVVTKGMEFPLSLGDIAAVSQKHLFWNLLIFFY